MSIRSAYNSMLKQIKRIDHYTFHIPFSVRNKEEITCFFEGLSKLKRQSLMTAIVLLVIGIVLIICPETYIGTLIDVLGILILITACIMILDYISSNKSLVDYILLTCARSRKAL